MAYNEEDYILLSGIQHFRFCRRQWALIHVENQWEENERTVGGELMHERAHDTGVREKRGKLLITHNLRVSSAELGVTGACDVVEFHQAENGVALAGENGLYQPYPIEYKHGAPRSDNANELQLCGQAMCLEQMLCCDIPKGALYFGQTRRRIEVEFTHELRQEVRDCLNEMHDLYLRGHTPKVKQTKACNACSLKEICLPKLSRTLSVHTYIRKSMEDKE